jgi:hypothetical protein
VTQKRAQSKTESTAEAGQDESCYSEGDCDYEGVAAVLVRIQDDEAARVGGHARDEKN